MHTQRDQLKPEVTVGPSFWALVSKIFEQQSLDMIVRAIFFATKTTRSGPITRLCDNLPTASATCAETIKPFLSF